jgi:hypothetical protein
MFKYLLRQAYFPLEEVRFPLLFDPLSSFRSTFRLLLDVFTSGAARFFEDIGGGDMESAGTFSAPFVPISSFVKRARSTSAAVNSDRHLCP